MQKYLPRTDVSFCTDCIDICLFLHFDNTFHWLIMNCLPKSQTQYSNANSSAVATVDRTVNDLLRLVLYCSIYLVLKLYWNFLFLCEIHHNGNIAHATCGGVIFYKLCWNRCIYYQLLYLFLLFCVGFPQVLLIDELATRQRINKFQLLIYLKLKFHVLLFKVLYVRNSRLSSLWIK